MNGMGMGMGIVSLLGSKSLGRAALDSVQRTLSLSFSDILVVPSLGMLVYAQLCSIH